MLPDGLTVEEHIALVELDDCEVQEHFREACHGLLNIHERWLTMKALGAVFRALRNTDTDIMSEIVGDNSE